VQLPSGSTVTGIAPVRSAVLIFGTRSVFLLSNVALDIVDANGNPQQSLQQLSDIQVWGKAGLASWANAVIAPCRDEVYLLDGISAPVPMSRSISKTYRSYVRAGYTPGRAEVTENHYLLPILNSAGTAKVAVLVCKLDHPIRDTVRGVLPVGVHGRGGGERVVFGLTTNGTLIGGYFGGSPY
jgi:hypothetical protein